MREWKQTLNLPRTEFPMRGNLPRKEKEILQFWERISPYSRLVGIRKSAAAEGKVFLLHDGPPYANGDIHVGHVLNKVLKDIVVKWKLMSGYYSPFVPGWDTHGLPTEQEVAKEYGLNRKEHSIAEWRKKCKDFATYYIQRQKEQFKRLGCFGDWEKPYVTYHPEYEAKEIRILATLGEKNLLYQRKKPIFWCPHCETALAEAEIEYEEVPTYSIYVALLLEKPLHLPDGRKVPAALVIWTTTPWTLPANVAVALHPTASYSLYHTEKGNFLLSDSRWEAFSQKLSLQKGEKWATWQGKSLENLQYYHPILGSPENKRLGLIEVFRKGEEYQEYAERVQRVVTSEMVDLSTGTGMVHIAPGHGEEDYHIGLEYGLPIFSPVDFQGRFDLPDTPWENAEEGFYFIQGMFYEDANRRIVERLKKKGNLLHEERLTHSYPHCWRCKNPVIFRATQQWFLDVEKIREDLYRAVDSIRWFPAWGREREFHMVKQRPDWCLSRQRVWGVPLPIFYCSSCGKAILSSQSVSRFLSLVKKEGVDVWWEKSADDLLPHDFACPYCGNRKGFEKEKDIVDVWFDSGVSHFAVLEGNEELTWPCDLYLEGTDQYRGWFQTSLITSVAVTGSPPMKQILTHGFVVDQDGRKMSKSIGNVIEPAEIVEKYGAEILRAWVVSADFTQDMKISEELLRYVIDSYRKLRNTLRFLLANLYDYSPPAEAPVGYLREIDRWILHQWSITAQQVHQAYEVYEFHQVYRLLHQFCVVQLSSFYLEAIKDRLYVYPAGSSERRAAQFVLSRILNGLLGFLAPILSFTAEEAYQNLPYKKADVPSIFLTPFPGTEEEWLNAELQKKWEDVLWLRRKVNQLLEKAKEADIKEPLDAVLTIYAGPPWSDVLATFSSEELEEIFGTSGVKVRSIGDFSEEILDWSVREEGLVLAVEKAGGKKCARCWKRYLSVGESEEYPDLCSRCLNWLTS
ncbi:MAG: isoleucine--tRNA ligase [bacterium JZ-2024 1]